MANTPISDFPAASSVNASDVLAGVQDGVTKKFSFAIVLNWIKQQLESLFVPTNREVNGKALSSDITLDASDVGAVDMADVGVADGVASLDSNGKVPGTQLNLSGKQDTITASGILKGDGQGGVSAATAGTDYQAPLTAGTDYATPAQLEGKANQSQLAYVETGTTASRNYTAGQYISLNGLLYTADTAIASGTTFYTSGGNKNLTEVSGGGFNRLAGRFPTDVGTGASANNLQSDAFGIYAGYSWADTPSQDRYKNGIVMVIPRQEGAVNCFQLYFSLDTSSAPLFIRMRTSSGTYTSWSTV